MKVDIQFASGREDEGIEVENALANGNWLWLVFKDGSIRVIPSDGIEEVQIRDVPKQGQVVPVVIQGVKQ